MKLSLTPRLQTRLDFRQFRQSGIASSHFRCLSRHVRHPVRTRLGLFAAWIASGLTFSSIPAIASKCGCIAAWSLRDPSACGPCFNLFAGCVLNSEVLVRFDPSCGI